MKNYDDEILAVIVGMVALEFVATYLGVVTLALAALGTVALLGVGLVVYNMSRYMNTEIRNFDPTEIRR